jgi:hypothetical protein
MWTEEELSDLDYESVYGHDAMHARLLARLDATLRRIEAQAARGTQAAVAARRPREDGASTQGQA